MDKSKTAQNNITDTFSQIFKSIPKSIIGLIFAMIVLISPFLSGKVSLSDDYGFHLSVMNSMHGAIDILKFKFLLPQILGGEIANGFGYGTGIFYPPLSYYLNSYIAYFIKLLNGNINVSTAILEIIILISSGFSMFICSKKVFKDNKVASIGSISYISSTYFLSNIYVRNAIGELLVYVFIPIIFLSLYELFYGKKDNFSILFIIGYIGIIYSHLVMTLYLTIFILLLFIFFIKKACSKENIIKLTVSSIIVLLITSPYLISLLEHKIYGDYIIFKPDSVYNNEMLTNNSIEIHEFFPQQTSNYKVKTYINLIVLFLSIITIAFNKKIFQGKERKIYYTALIIIIVSMFMSSSLFPWEKMPHFMKVIQFPWRLRTITSFGLAILAANSIRIVKQDNKEIISILLALGLLFYGYNTINISTLKNSDEIVNRKGMGLFQEYLPSKTHEHYEYYNSRDREQLISTDNNSIEIIENSTPYLKAAMAVQQA